LAPPHAYLAKYATQEVHAHPLRNIYTEHDERREGVGLVVMAGYRRAVVELRDELTALRPELRLIAAGDALAPRTLLDAVAEGARAGADV
jgi:hypothetical protein